MKKSASPARSANLFLIKLQGAIVIYLFIQSIIIIQNIQIPSYDRHYLNSHHFINCMYARESERGMKIYNLLFNSSSDINLDRGQVKYEVYLTNKIRSMVKLHLPFSQRNSN